MKNIAGSKRFSSRICYGTWRLRRQKWLCQELLSSFKQKKTLRFPWFFHHSRWTTRHYNKHWCYTIPNEYRSHFGSRYKLGCCDIAGLFQHSFHFTAQRTSKPVHSNSVAARLDLRKSVSAWSSSAKGHVVPETQGAGVAARYLWWERQLKTLIRYSMVISVLRHGFPCMIISILRHGFLW